ncbi:MAG: hypothetical protein ABSD20_14580 [Terriglobales bacterium]|jgi:hypothetical protein
MRKKTRRTTLSSLKDKALLCAESALTEAALSEEDEGWYSRVLHAERALDEIRQRLAAGSNQSEQKKAQQHELEMRERKLRVLESRNERERLIYEAEKRKRERRPPTLEQVNLMRARVFGLPPLPPGTLIGGRKS